MKVEPDITCGDYLSGFLQGTRRALHENGRESLTITIDRLKATGTAGLGGSPSRLALDWTEEFKPVKTPTTRVTLKGTVDESLKRLVARYKGKIAVGVHLNDVFSIPRYLAGFEGLLIALADEPDLVRRLVAMSVEVNIELAKEVFHLLSHAITSLKLYPSDHATVVKFVDELYDQVRVYLADREMLEVDVQEHTILEGDTFLLCSDGLSRMVPDAAIAGAIGECRRARGVELAD